MFQLCEKLTKETHARRNQEGTKWQDSKQLVRVYELNGKKLCLNLGVAIKGTPPESLRGTGDYVFERTRAQAQEKLLSIVNEARSIKNSQYTLEKLYEQKTGNSITEVELCNLIEAWRNIPRRKSLSPKYVTTCSTTLRRLVKFIHPHAPKITDLSAVNNITWSGDFSRQRKHAGSRQRHTTIS